MCQFCHQHGEGQKWYLQTKNYAEDLLSDLRRRKMITDFFSHPDHLGKAEEQLEQLDRLPGFVRRVIRWRSVNEMKKTHYGQVVPIEDIERIFAFSTSIVRLPCICRYNTVGPEQRYCYGASLAPNLGQMGELVRSIDPNYLMGPKANGLETLSKEEAIDAFHQHEQEGLCHTVWTFVTPFIGGICNCDRADCNAMQATVVHDMPVMFRAEYVAEINLEQCNGCRVCMRACQFGALAYSAAQKKVVVDLRRCYGCGVCRALCAKNAITLRDRTSVPVAAHLW
jgi:ferredoxin